MRVHPIYMHVGDYAIPDMENEDDLRVTEGTEVYESSNIDFLPRGGVNQGIGENWPGHIVTDWTAKTLVDLLPLFWRL